MCFKEVFPFGVRSRKRKGKEFARSRGSRRRSLSGRKFVGSLARRLLGLPGVEILRPEQRVLEAAIELRSARGELLAENVANADTPGYLQRDLSFDDALAQVLDGEQPGTQPVARNEIISQNLRFDRNDVDVNRELSRVYDNAVKYVTTLKLYSDSVSRLKAAMSTA